MATATPHPAANQRPREILIVSHSTLFYWWPVWAVGYMMAIISLPLLTGERVYLAPEKADFLHNATGSAVEKSSKGPGLTEEKTVEFTNQNVLIAPKPASEKSKSSPIQKTEVHISTSKNLGVLFVMVLLVVIFITNVPLRGLWSVIVIIFLVALVIILALLGVLDAILDFFFIFDIRITLGGYVVIATVLLALWLVIFFLFDRQIYMVFTPGQLRVKLEIGDAETAYDTTGMTIQKQRSDLFRHWILGIGSGDLIVRTAGAQGHQFDMPNVLFLGRKVREIEDMLRSRQVVSGQ
jgi:hypothetical protein